MSKKLIADLFAAVDANDWNALSAVLHEDVVYERPGYDPLVGRDRVLYFYANERVVAQGHHEPECVMAEGGVGLCSGRFHGTKKDNTQADERFADVYEFEGGRIRHRITYFFRPAI
ncbi:MAG: nuclear transport factor 2 family protein [Rhizobacter sp.]